MNQKLIKLSDTHYIVVDDSKIKERDWVSYTNLKQFIPVQYFGGDLTGYEKKITHSTQLLERDYSQATYGVQYAEEFDKIKPLSLSEVEEAINGYDLVNLSKKATEHQKFANGLHEKTVAEIYYRKGFNAHKELVKDVVPLDKVFEILDLHTDAAPISYLKRELVKLLLPKTEWNVEITPQGKIKII